MHQNHTCRHSDKQVWVLYVCSRKILKCYYVIFKYQTLITIIRNYSTLQKRSMCFAAFDIFWQCDMITNIMHPGNYPRIKWDLFPSLYFHSAWGHVWSELTGKPTVNLCLIRPSNGKLLMLSFTDNLEMQLLLIAFVIFKWINVILLNLVSLDITLLQCRQTKVCWPPSILAEHYLRLIYNAIHFRWVVTPTQRNRVTEPLY